MKSNMIKLQMRMATNMRTLKHPVGKKHKVYQIQLPISIIKMLKWRKGDKLKLSMTHCVIQIRKVVKT